MDLKSLKAALAPLSKFGQEEFSFDVEGLSVALRPLLPKEEVACQQYAASLLKSAKEEEDEDEDDPLSRATALRYFDQFRTAVISYSLVQIGEADLRGLETIETGEVLENGTPIKEPLNVAIRKIINDSWSRGMITITFAKYGDMITKVSERADKVARESLADLDAEIDRVTARLFRLKEDREKRAKGDPSITAQQIQSLVAAGEAMEREITDTIDQSRADREMAEALQKIAEEEPEAMPEPSEPEPRKSVLPASSPPPTKQPSPPQFRSSFEDPDEPDTQAIEEDRVRAAALTAAQEDLGAGDISQAQHLGAMKGPDGEPLLDDKGKPIQSYKLAPETLSARGKTKKTQSEIDADPKQGSVNPKFKR